ncbi:MAG: hypothetical protein ABIJ56_21385 [Pseudomonadota bacterium]
MTNQWKSIIHSLPIVILAFILSSAFPACFTQFDVDDNKDTTTDQRNDDSGGDTAGDQVGDQVDDDTPGVDAGDDDAGGDDADDVEEEEEPFVNPWPGLVESEPSIVPLDHQIRVRGDFDRGVGDSGGLLLAMHDNDLLAFSTYQTYESATDDETAHYNLYQFDKDRLGMFGMTTVPTDDHICNQNYRPWECALDNLIALITEDDTLYLLQGVIRQPVVGDAFGNIRVLKFNAGYGYVKTSKLIDDLEIDVGIPYPSQLMAVQCGDDYHIIMGPMEEGDGGFQTDLYAVTTDTMGMYGLFKTRPEYIEWGSATLFSTESGRFLTSSACRWGDTLHLGVFDMKLVEIDGTNFGYKMQSKVLQFDTGPMSIPRPIDLITNPGEEDPPMEGMPVIGVQHWGEDSRVFAGWYVNDTMWTEENPPDWFDLHMGFANEDELPPIESHGDRAHVAFPVIPIDSEGPPDFSNYKMFVDEGWEVVYVTGLWYDVECDPDSGECLGETTIYIFVFDRELNPLVEAPYITKINLAALYGFDSIFDRDSGSIYFAWYDYEGGLPRTGETMNQLAVKKYSLAE